MELFHHSCWNKEQEVSIINQDFPSMSTHSALSMGNNLTASGEDMSDDFQTTFSLLSFLEEEEVADTEHLHVPSLLQQYYRFMLKIT